ncbi:MAG: MFS transporter [Bryobacteraceae bacterium]
MTNWAFAIRALRSRNYRLFFGGQSISLIGTWMTRLATAWLVYRLTGSEVLLGVIGFASQIPAFVLGPIAGVWVDRWDRHRTLIVTQVLSMLQSFALAALALSNVITVNELIALALFQGVINAFDMPVRQSFVIRMVENRDDLGNAIALNSSMVNGARLIGPAIAGAMVAATNEGWCFFIDGVSYIAVIASLLAMRVAAGSGAAPRRHVFQELAEGWNYITGSLAIRSILVMVGLISLAGMPYSVLMPVVVSDVLHGGPHTLGWLMAATGAGAFAGAVSLALRRSVLGLGRLIALSAGVFGLALIAFAWSRSLWVSLAVLPLVGFGMMRQMAASNTILQTIVSDEKRGRVMAFYSMAFLGMAPFGSLIAGYISARIGAPRTIALSGVVCIAGAAWFALRLPALRDVIRPIYRDLGILPEMTQGVGEATALQTPHAQ